MRYIVGMGVAAAVIAAILGGGGVNLSFTETAEAHGTCRDHQYRTYDGTHDSDDDGVGCESNPEPPGGPPGGRSPGSGPGGSGSTDGGSTQPRSSGYDRDNWDYNSSRARDRLGCTSSEHVDHIVALKEAYDSGASAWSNARKSQFANDPLNQWCLAAGLNISKSDGDLAEWRGGSCGQRKYIAIVTVQVKRRYSLSTDSAEQRAISVAQSATCSADGAAGGPTVTEGRIVARRLADGRTEFGFQPRGGERVLPRVRYFPSTADVGRWLSSSPIEVDGVEIGRINARLVTGGRIEFAFTPTGRGRILPASRYLPSSPAVERWLRSSEIDVGG